MRPSLRLSLLAARGALVAAVVCVTNAASGQLVQQPLDPKTYASPSGTFTFTVDPSDVYGRGEATYRVSKLGKEVWAKSLPFTLFGAEVTDAGIAAGYGYTRGERVSAENAGEALPGDLVVAIFDPSGSLRLKQVVRRWSDKISPERPLPFAYGLVVDEANDRLVVRLEDFRHFESWRTYRLSTGAILEKRTPGRWAVVGDGPIHIVNARLIDDTPLILLECVEGDPIGPRARGPRILFRLVDAEAKPVWSLVPPGEISVKANNPEGARLGRWINAHGRILRGDRPRQCDVVLAAHAQRVTYAAERNASGAWTVKEIARAPFVLPSPHEPKTLGKEQSPLKARGTIVLEPGRAAGKTPGRSVLSTRLGRIAAITLDKRGRFVAVDGKSGAIHVFDGSGKLLHVGPSLSAAAQAALPDLMTDDNCGIYLDVEEPDQSDGKRLYAHFSADAGRLENVVLPGQRCAFQPGQGLVVAIIQSEVRLVNGRGKSVRTIKRRPDHCWLEHPQGLAVAPDGSLAVFARRLIGAETTVSLYKPNGDPVSTIRLPESAGGFPKLAYDGRRLVVAGDNALLIYDVAGKPLVCCDPPLDIPDGAFYYALILPGGRELALYDGRKPVLHRFELP